jgi:tetratricopeptide (TPR) repeat protein
MSEMNTDTYFKDPVFQQAMRHLQAGEWSTGLKGLNSLTKKYPHDPELRAMRQEMHLRARIDQYEKEDIQEHKKIQLFTWGLRLGIITLLLLIGFFGIKTYSNWFQQQWAMTRDKIEDEVQVLEVALQFRNAQNLILAGEFSQAEQLLNELSSQYPDYPGLAEARSQLGTMSQIDQSYAQALSLMDAGQMGEALALFETIDAQQPFYKDVNVLITNLKSQSMLGDVFVQAARAYERGSWAEAVASYETIRALDPEYRAEEVEEQLFNAYINAADEEIAKDANSIENLNIAENYYQKALTLRPQDPIIREKREKSRETVKDRLTSSYVLAAQNALTEEADSLAALNIAEQYLGKALAIKPEDPTIRQQFEMAQRYVAAQDEYVLGSWDGVITNLEFVVGLDPEYAKGTTRQTLYEAYIARGNESIVKGDFELALSDYERSAVLAEQDTESKIRLYEAQIKVAEAHGLLGNYEQAVLIYRAAIELADLSNANISELGDVNTRLDQAERYANGRNFRTSYRLFKEAAKSVLLVFPKVTHIVQEGEYLTQLANRYNTTVEAILSSSGYTSAKVIIVGQELKIPVEP